MDDVGRARLKVALARHFDGMRGEADAEADSETLGRVVQAMLAEDARSAEAGVPVIAALQRPGRMDAQGIHAERSRIGKAAAFVASQVRYIPAGTWAMQIALVALMCAVAFAGRESGVAKLAVGIFSIASVLVGMPGMAASKRYRMAELEYACENNAASVQIARLIVLGCSSSAAVALMIGAASASLDLSVFTVALWACPPFFCSCAGSLMVLRRAAPSSALGLSVVWTLACTGMLMVCATVFPEMYAQTSLTVWIAAATAALIWLAREIACTLRAASRGLDAFAPHLARTRN